ncbi:hypothetical protein [Bradyrhizobium sp.]|uniref:hypothetical protein n=1 Tax=Bradyrhizobium sp. TaxID=376 RepID=UPI0039E35BFA
MSSTERSKKCRALARSDRYLLSLEVGLDIVDMLIDLDYLLFCDSQNRAKIQDAFARWVSDLATRHSH